MLVLGVDTACDDTGAAVVLDGHDVLSNVVSDQVRTHARFGGVVPELAARRHVEVILPTIDVALEWAGVGLEAIDAVAVNARHGLLRSVSVGVATAKSLAYARQLPFVGVHHVEAHIYSALIEEPEATFPLICLAVAGGHNLLIEMTGHGNYEIIGRTLDDAAGEAFDKVARLLDLPFPGGPQLAALAAEGGREAYEFPRPLLQDRSLDFSFSGLKTAVANTVQSETAAGTLDASGVAASFQEAAVDVLVGKTLRAAKSRDVRMVTVVGGVAANERLRGRMQSALDEAGIRYAFAPRQYCTDNGAMIASLGWYRLLAGERDALDLDARARTPFSDLRTPTDRPAGRAGATH